MTYLDAKAKQLIPHTGRDGIDGSEVWEEFKGGECGGGGGIGRP